MLAKTHQKDTETTKSILETLVVLEAIDGELYKVGVIWCQKFVTGIAEAYHRTVEGCPQRPVEYLEYLSPDFSEKSVTVDKTGDNVKDLGVIPTVTTESGTLIPQTKLKETKLKETKLNNSSNIIKEIFKLFEDNFQRITEITRDIISDHIDEYGEEKVLEALKESIKYNKRNLAYVGGILKNNGRPKTGAMSNLKTKIYTVSTAPDDYMAKKNPV